MNADIAQSKHNGFPNDKSFRFLACPEHLLVWIGNQTGTCEFVSPSWTAFTGRELTLEFDDGWLNNVHQDDRDTLLQKIQVACETKSPFLAMFRNQRADGIYRHFICRGTPRFSRSSEFVGHIGLCYDVTPYQDGELELELGIHSVFSLLKHSRLLAVALDTEGKVQFSNSGLSRTLECPGNVLLDRKLFDHHLARRDRALIDQLYPDGTQSTLFPSEFQSELMSESNQSRYVSWHSVIWREFSGRLKGVVLIGDDNTALYREEEETALYLKAFEATSHGIVLTSINGTILSVNSAFTFLTGYSREEALGKNPRMLQSGRHDQSFYLHLWQTLTSTGHWHGDIWDRHKSGRIYPKFLSISAIKNPSGETTNYVGIFYDNSERKTIEERLVHIAHYDSLTGVPNRCLLLDRLDQAIERARRNESKIGLLYIDLDHFKQVNDTYGHCVGDELLKQATQRMSECMRGSDTVARLGGDEFVTLVPDITDVEDIQIVAKKLLNALSPNYEIDGFKITCTPSIGISIFPNDSDCWKELMKCADVAMYQAKQSGRGIFRFFNES